VVLSGEAGKGLKTIEMVLVKALNRSGFNVFATKEYMSRVRGGNNTVEIVVSSREHRAFLDRMDILVPLNKDAIYRLAGRIDEDTVIVGDPENVKEDYRKQGRFLEMGFQGIAEKVGDRIYANSVAAGVVGGILEADSDSLKTTIERIFEKKGEKVIDKNKEAVAQGYRRGRELAGQNDLDFDLDPDDSVKNHMVLNGAEAVSLGAIAGGCNFISSYPMSPSTGVLVFLSRHAPEFGIVSEQAEDEISAINMALGAWYAGARAMVTTSGGGFALMVEGLSLAAMVETPVVIHLAQRPGPATGLPTRTEQADLLFALRAGHGEFPRIILSPGTLEDAFSLSCQAFNLADRFQVPVFILTDQCLMDTYYDLCDLDLSGAKAEKAIVKTRADYKRYRLTEDGISPRGIPGYGKGLVMADSDEHDEYGRITEDMDTRVDMVEKRLKKLDLMRAAAVEPELFGSDAYRTLVVSWGSTYHAVREAISCLKDEGVALLHLAQVFPMHEKVTEHIARAEQVVTVENNATAQLGTLLALETGRGPDRAVLKYNGLPFCVEELRDMLADIDQEDINGSQGL
jgi:2-oxoglutarate ferredoxin oxidoreductase subunit alpha